jgi:hypothetical protein
MLLGAYTGTYTGAYTATLYVMVNIVKGGERALPTLTMLGQFSIMMEFTPESGRCNSVCTLWTRKCIKGAQA